MFAVESYILSTTFQNLMFDIVEYSLDFLMHAAPREGVSICFSPKSGDHGIKVDTCSASPLFFAVKRGRANSDFVM